MIPTSREILGDLEQAIGDKGSRCLGAGKNVLSEADMKRILAEMGPVEAGSETAGAAPGPGVNQAARETTGPKRLYLVREGEMIAGVCLGQPRAVVAGRPRTSVLTSYFRRASIDGMTNPFALEVIVNPDVLPFERPMVLAHEWAHLAGFADEAEAGFLAWITCLRGSDQARYSAWVSLFPGFPHAVQTEAARQLEAGPRRDLAAIRARLQRASPTVTRFAWSGYDRFLRAHRVAEGVASYDLVVRLVAGTEFDEAWRPRLRRDARTNEGAAEFLPYQ